MKIAPFLAACAFVTLLSGCGAAETAAVTAAQAEAAVEHWSHPSIRSP